MCIYIIIAFNNNDVAKETIQKVLQTNNIRKCE